MRGVLFKPVPFADPATLVKVDEQTKGIVDYRWGDRWAFSYPNFLDCQRGVRSLDDGGLPLRRRDRQRSRRSRVRRRAAGLGQPDVGAWRARSRGAACCRKTIGRARRRSPSSVRRCGSAALAAHRRRSARRSTFEATPYTIVGVAPATFDVRGADRVLTPIAQNTRPFMRLRGAHPGISVWARLRPGATRAAAQAELDVDRSQSCRAISGIEREPQASLPSRCGRMSAACGRRCGC